MEIPARLFPFSHGSGAGGRAARGSAGRASISNDWKIDACLAPATGWRRPGLERFRPQPKWSSAGVRGSPYACLGAKDVVPLKCGVSKTRVGAIMAPKETPFDTDREFSADFDRQASATNSVSFLGLSPAKASKTVSFFISFHRGAAQSGILLLDSIERGTSRRVYHRRPWLSDMSPPGGTPFRFLARPGCGARRCVGPKRAESKRPVEP